MTKTTYRNGQYWIFQERVMAVQSMWIEMLGKRDRQGFDGTKEKKFLLRITISQKGQ